MAEFQKGVTAYRGGASLADNRRLLATLIGYRFSDEDVRALQLAISFQEYAAKALGQDPEQSGCRTLMSFDPSERLRLEELSKSPLAAADQKRGAAQALQQIAARQLVFRWLCLAEMQYHFPDSWEKLNEIEPGASAHFQAVDQPPPSEETLQRVLSESGDFSLLPPYLRAGACKRFYALHEARGADSSGRAACLTELMTLREGKKRFTEGEDLPFTGGGKYTPGLTGPIADSLLGPAQSGERLYNVLTGTPACRDRYWYENLNRLGRIDIDEEPPPNCPPGYSDDVLKRGLFSKIGSINVTPNDGAVVILALFVAITAARLLWTILGRLFGFYNPSSFRYWLWLPWRPLYRLWLHHVVHRFQQLRIGTKATARWAGVLEAMTLTFKPGESVLVGRLWAHSFGLFQPIGIKGTAHVAMFARTGAGKTVQLMTMLGTLHKDASAFVIDCDGQMVNSLGGALRNAGHKVALLDPYRTATFEGSTWNAIEEIDRGVARHGREAAVRFAETLAEALIRKEPNPENEWVSAAARIFIRSLILYIWLSERSDSEQRNLPRLRRLLTAGMPELARPKEDPFLVLLFEMITFAEKVDDGCGGAICAAIDAGANDMKSYHSRDGKNAPKSCAMTETAWLDLPELARMSRTSTFACEDLKSSNICLFICAPVTEISGKLSGWVRALTVMTMYAFQTRHDVHPSVPALFVIDEMPALGHIEALATSAPVFRKYGVRLVAVAQDLEKLEKVYPKDWRGFIGGAQCSIWMGLTDPQTLAFLGEQIGKKTRSEYIGSSILSRREGRTQTTDRELITQQQLKEFLEPSKGQIIVYRSEGRPLRLAHAPYFTELPVWSYLPDPKYGEARLRRLGRRWFGRDHTSATRTHTPERSTERRSTGEPALALVPQAPSRDVASDSPAYAAPGPSGANRVPPAPPVQQASVRETREGSAAEKDRLLFLDIFSECFHEARGTYINDPVRKAVWCFAKELDEDSDFATQHAHFENWLSSAAAKMREDQARRAASYFETALQRILEERERSAEGA